MTKVIVICLLLSAALMAQPSPVGLITAVELSDFSSSENGNGAMGKTIYGGSYYAITNDLYGYVVAEYGNNKTENGTAEEISGMLGAAWDVIDVAPKWNCEMGVLFQGGLSALDLSGFDPTSKFGWVGGIYLKFPIKNSNVKMQLYGRLKGYADVVKPAIGLAIAVPFALKK